MFAFSGDERFEMRLVAEISTLCNLNRPTCVPISSTVLLARSQYEPADADNDDDDVGFDGDVSTDDVIASSLSRFSQIFSLIKYALNSRLSKSSVVVLASV